MKVFLAGEGAGELGGRARRPPYRTSDRGVIEALLRKVRPDGWHVGDAVCWKDIRKYRVGQHRGPDMRNVIGAALMARDAGCDALVFTRDRDGDLDREGAIEAGIDDPARPPVHVAGGVAVEMIEAWVLALGGEHGSETHCDPKAVLRARGVAQVSAMVEVVDRGDLARLPDDAGSLRRWIARARTVLFAVTPAPP
jgi:hypothetical protein